MEKTNVYPAEPYRFGELGSFGKASYMLIKQFNFPNTYDSTLDKLDYADHDRCFKFDYAHAESCCKKHLGSGPMALGEWARKSSEKQIFEFLAEILKVEKETWTGFRIMATVGGNGYPVYTMELFYKNPDSDTQVYSGEPAPNVLKNPRRK